MTRRISRRLPFALALVAGFCFAQPSAAQVSVEGRVGSALPSGELTASPGLDQTAGFSFAIDAMLSLRPTLTTYAGASRQSFHCAECSTDVSTAGFDAGLKYLFPASGAATPWVRGGLMLHRASVDGVDSDWGVGVDAGVGVDWLVGPRVSVVPAVRMNSYGSGPVSLTYFTIDLGLHLHPEW